MRKVIIYFHLIGNVLTQLCVQKSEKSRVNKRENKCVEENNTPKKESKGRRKAGRRRDWKDDLTIRREIRENKLKTTKKYIIYIFIFETQIELLYRERGSIYM